jgi:UDPglucose--hexose-1-phosphate uridylyltransferase
MEKEDFSVNEHSHRRYNPLSDEWLLVSPHRSKRPWQGQQEENQWVESTAHHKDCYLCPTNTRVNGEINPAYETTYVFKNDFSALSPEVPTAHEEPDPLFQIHAEQGTSRVICFSPDHSKTLPLLTKTEILSVINTWISEVADLGKTYTWVQIFENKGSVMGCSNPHPHGQVWAQTNLPSIAKKEDETQKKFYEQYQKPLLLDYAQKEIKLAVRVVSQNEDWVVVVPFWASWPFETLLLPKNSCARITDLTQTEKVSLGSILQDITTRYDNLFKCSFPYSMGWHGAPFNSYDSSHWQLHAHFYPPLLRSASVKKFMVGYEMLAEPQRDISPEQAAEQLRQQSSAHFLNKNN